MAARDPETRHESARVAALTRWGHEREARLLQAATARRKAAEANAEAARIEAELAAMDGAA